jgi:hypothetical protein
VSVALVPCTSAKSINATSTSEERQGGRERGSTAHGFALGEVESAVLLASLCDALAVGTNEALHAECRARLERNAGTSRGSVHARSMVTDIRTGGRSWCWWGCWGRRAWRRWGSCPALALCAAARNIDAHATFDVAAALPDACPPSTAMSTYLGLGHGRKEQPKCTREHFAKCNRARS